MCRTTKPWASGDLHFCRIPVALLQAVAVRKPKNLHYTSWGGGLPLELLLAAGCVGQITFCFSSLDVFGMAPLFRKACESGEIKLNELNALAFLQGLHAAQQQLPSMPYPIPYGSDFCTQLPQEQQTSGIGQATALPLDVLLLHATRADESGNVEILGALGSDMSMAWAARQILVTVEEIVPNGTLDARATGVLPRDIITAIAKVPGGALPCSSPGHYIADFKTLGQGFKIRADDFCAPTPEREKFLRNAAKIKPEQVTPALLAKHSKHTVGPDAPATAGEIMIHRLAQEYDGESYCSGGAVSPLAIVSYLLGKHAHPSLSLMVCSGGYVDIAPRPMLMICADVLDNQTAAVVCGGDDTYHFYYQRGLITHEVVGAAQIDSQARTNNQWLKKPDGTPVRLPGQGGMADVANMHANFILYMPRHSKMSLVNEVNQCSASRGVVNATERAKHGWQPGKVMLVTDLCVFELDEASTHLQVTSLHPGVTAEQVREATGFEVVMAKDVGITEIPSAAQLRLIREEIDPLGFRRLEFVASRDRQGLIAELIDAEEAAMAEIIG